MRLSWLLVGLAGVPLLALDPTSRLTQYHKRHWQLEDGLKHNYVTGLASSPEGYLYLGTREGLAKFDGVRFAPLEVDPSLGLARRWITRLVPARRGGYLVSTYDGGGYLWRGGKWQALIPPEMSGGVQNVLEDGQGRVWIGLNGVHVVEKGALRTLQGISGGPGNSWMTFAEEPEGRMWIVSGEGLRLYRDGRAEMMAPNGDTGQALSVMREKDGRLWLGTSKGLFLVVRENGGARLLRQAGVDGPVVAMLRDSDGLLWAGTWGRGLYRVTASGADKWTSLDGLPDDFIRVLHEDGEGNLWIGTRSGGLSRWKDPVAVPFGIPEGLGGNFASAVIEDPSGVIWLGTWRSGLFQFRSNAIVREPTPRPPLDFLVNALAQDARGTLWIGNEHGLQRFDGRNYRSLSPGQRIPQASVSALLVDRAGGLWLGTDRVGLMRYAHGDPFSEEGETMLAAGRISSLLEDRRGRIWVGSMEGLARIDGKGVSREGLPKEEISSLTEDTGGRVWALTFGGSMVLVSEAEVRALGPAQGLPGQALYRMLDDGKRWYWISTARGIARISRQQVDEVLAGRRAAVDAVVLEQEDGLRTIECHGLSQPAGWRARDGGLWFPTAKGFVRIRPERMHAWPPPKVVVEAVRSGGETLKQATEYRLAPGTQEVEIQFTALRFASPEHVRFRHRMEGYDADWVEHGGERTVRYSKLPPGRFRFVVSARDAGGEWTEHPAEVWIRQEPRFHQTGWFMLLMAIAAGCTIYGLYRWRVYVLRGRYAAVLEERNRIAREWHDTLLAGFAAISWQLDVTLTRLREKPEKARETVETAREMVRHYRAEARRVIWDLRDSQPLAVPLAEAVKQAIAPLATERGAKLEVEVVGEAVELDSDLRQNLLRICQEAASNALRHGKASRVTVRFDYEPGALRLTVEDDGIGFEAERTPGAMAGHFGLAMMRERAQRFGGSLTVSSRIGNGTIVEAVVAPQGPRIP